MPFLCRAKHLRCPAGAVEDVTCRRGALACELACVGPAGEHVPRAGNARSRASAPLEAKAGCSRSHFGTSVAENAPAAQGEGRNRFFRFTPLLEKERVLPRVRNILCFHKKARMSVGKRKDKTAHPRRNSPSEKCWFFEADRS